MVVLTDFIRRADFPADEADLKPVKHLGVVPIFEQIRRSQTNMVRLGILSGTLTVIPSQSARPCEPCPGVWAEPRRYPVQAPASRPAVLRGHDPAGRTSTRWSA